KTPFLRPGVATPSWRLRMDECTWILIEKRPRSRKPSRPPSEMSTRLVTKWLELSRMKSLKLHVQSQETKNETRIELGRGNAISSAEGKGSDFSHFKYLSKNAAILG